MLPAAPGVYKDWILANLISDPSLHHIDVLHLLLPSREVCWFRLFFPPMEFLSLICSTSSSNLEKNQLWGSRIWILASRHLGSESALTHYNYKLKSPIYKLKQYKNEVLHSGLELLILLEPGLAPNNPTQKTQTWNFFAIFHCKSPCWLPKFDLQHFNALLKYESCVKNLFLSLFILIR